MNNDLVFLEPNRLDAEPFTTSDVIAQYGMVKRETVSRLIQKHENSLAAFGKVGFKIRASEGSATGQSEKIYTLNEPQATLLITFMKNTAPVVRFKTELVREFYRMRQELAERQLHRALGKPIRRTLTDAIRDSGEDERMHGHAYGTYTDLAYKFATGRIARQLRKERGAAPKATATDFLAADELERYNTMEGRITVLLDMGLQYDQIKGLIVHQLTAKAAG